MRDYEGLDANDGVRACRPGRATKGVRTNKRQKKVGLDSLIHRFENGLDLWSGEQLIGQEATDWLHLQFEMAEEQMKEKEAEEFFERATIPLCHVSA